MSKVCSQKTIPRFLGHSDKRTVGQATCAVSFERQNPQWTLLKPHFDVIAGHLCCFGVISRWNRSLFFPGSYSPTASKYCWWTILNTRCYLQHIHTDAIHGDSPLPDIVYWHLRAPKKKRSSTSTGNMQGTTVCIQALFHSNIRKHFQESNSQNSRPYFVTRM